MTVSEIMAAGMDLAEAADVLDGKPMDSTEALARKLAGIADAQGMHAAAVDVTGAGFTDEERSIITPAVVERAERFMQATSEKMRERVKKINDARMFPVLPKKADGWYFDASAVTPDVPEYGPYDTKKDCEEARSSFIRSNRDREKVAAKEEAKAKARASGTGSKKKTGEPTAAVGVTIQPEGKTKESEATVKSDHPKKQKGAKVKGGKATKAAADKPKADKPAKAPKAKKATKDPGEKKLSALDAAHEVLKNRTKPMSAKELIEVMAERKLWSSPGGKTPDATLAAALVREINGKGKESRFAKPEAGKFAAK